MRGSLEAKATCNQCSEELSINLVEGVAGIRREQRVGTVWPDLALLDANGEPVRFIEVVDSHAPESNVHEYALANDIEIVEIHLRAEREFTGRRRNKALDASLTVKARLRELAQGRIQVDAHNLLCRKPPCQDCGTPLPLRTVAIRTTDCWHCGQNVNVAAGYKDGESLWQDLFTTEEMEFAQENGVTLKRRFSATAGEKYLANICTGCERIQGNWFLYDDPFHERFNLLSTTVALDELNGRLAPRMTNARYGPTRSPTKDTAKPSSGARVGSAESLNCDCSIRTERQEYGPCDKCASRYCMTHGEYLDYRDTNQCPACLEEAERVMCPNNADRECFYPDRCRQGGCYFVNREQKRLEAQQEWERQHQEWEREQQELREQQQEKNRREQEQRQREWAELNEWFRKQRNQ